MGAVYEAENLLIRRRVAIKVMHGSALRNRELSGRFQREAQVVNQIQSEHVVQVLDFGQLAEGDPFIVMEFLDGQTLSERIQSVPVMTAEEILPLIDQVLSGLQAAHDADVIHRDIKPDNIFLITNSPDRKDFVKLLDFGVSKVEDTGGEPRLTQTGATIGTPGYMAPEQIGAGSKANARADVYAVGVILYRALTGRAPFSSDRLNELLTQIAQGTAPAPHEVNPNVDPALGRIVARAMSRDPEERHASAASLRMELRAWRGMTSTSIGPYRAGPRTTRVSSSVSPTGSVTTSPTVAPSARGRQSSTTRWISLAAVAACLATALWALLTSPAAPPTEPSAASSPRTSPARGVGSVQPAASTQKAAGFVAPRAREQAPANQPVVQAAGSGPALAATPESHAGAELPDEGSAPPKPEERKPSGEKHKRAPARQRSVSRARRAPRKAAGGSAPKRAAPRRAAEEPRRGSEASERADRDTEQPAAEREAEGGAEKAGPARPDWGY